LFLEYALPSSATLSEVLGNQMPPIQYRRHSNLNRLSISISINPPHQDETCFILRPIQNSNQQENIQENIQEDIQENHQEDIQENIQSTIHQHVLSNENPVHRK
jgi:hypothetical protein